MIILGINAYHGDSAACLINEGDVIAACEEERFRRIKHYAGLPALAIQSCLKQSNIKLQDIDFIAISRNPQANLSQKILYTLTHGSKISKLIRSRFDNALKVIDIKKALENSLGEKFSPRTKVYQIEHHLAHLASAFFASPFEEAAILSVDGFGDFVSTKLGYARQNTISVFDQVSFPHSLGIFYTAFTQYLGFQNYGDEYKVMALAAYGEPRYESELNKILLLDSQGTFRLNLDFFNHHQDGVEMNWQDGYPNLSLCYSSKLIDQFGPARLSHEPITQHHKDLAATVQKTFETAYFHLLNRIYEKTKSENVCLSGGCAFNSVANGKIPAFTPFKHIFIQPAAGDAGTALGAALFLEHSLLNRPRQYQMNHAYLGPEYQGDEVEEAVKTLGLPYHKLTDSELIENAAKALSEGKIVGWYQGRMEFGSRALGNRSLLADPRQDRARQWLNQKIKVREDFRPFAPSVLKEDIHDYFEEADANPFMTQVFQFKKEKQGLVPAVVHVDGTGRLQSVDQKTNPKFWSLLNEFKKLTGIGMLLNTSFNENEPIVCSPEDALNCFIRTKFDFLALHNFWLSRTELMNLQEELCLFGATKK